MGEILSLVLIGGGGDPRDLGQCHKMGLMKMNNNIYDFVG